MNTICIIANNKIYKGGDKMEIKPCKCFFTHEIFCLVRLDPDETKRDILKKEQEIRQKCLKLCQDEDEAITVTEMPIITIPKPCGYVVCFVKA